MFFCSWSKPFELQTSNFLKSGNHSLPCRNCEGQHRGDGYASPEETLLDRVTPASSFVFHTLPVGWLTQPTSVKVQTTLYGSPVLSAENFLACTREGRREKFLSP